MWIRASGQASKRTVCGRSSGLSSLQRVKTDLRDLRTRRRATSVPPFMAAGVVIFKQIRDAIIAFAPFAQPR